MTEDAQEQSAQGFDLPRILGIARRRHMHFLIPAFLGWLVIWASTWFLQARYKSGTMILVERPTMPKNYVVPNVDDDLQDRLQSIKQQVLSRTRLLQIIDKFNLYGHDRRHLTPDEKVAMMANKDIDIELVKDARTEAISAFSISYSSNDPRVAQAVAGELTDLFITTNTSVAEQQSEDATDFLKKQLELARSKLLVQEEKMKSFETAHEGSLPEQETSNLQILQSVSAELQSANSALANAKQQREYIQTEIGEYKMVHGTTRSPDGKPTGLAALDLQLDQLDAKLTDLRSHYTEQYPDVVATEQQIANTEKARDALAADLRSKAAAAKNDDSVTADDPAASTALLQLQAQLRANQLEIANRERQIDNLQGKVNKIEAQVSAEPAVEQQLADLKRGYDQAQKDYDELFKKESDSEQATNLTKLQRGERFTVLDPAPLPSKPDFPNRLKFCGMGLGAGMALGALVVLAFEFLDDRMHSEGEIKALLPIAVLSEIPEVLTEADKRKIKHKMVLRWAMTAAVAVVMLVGSAFSYLKG